MGTGYTRNDTGNNIADGNVINASDLDGEYNAIEAAFDASTGHTHDGTSAEGAPIEVAGPAQDLVITATEVRPKTDNTLDLGTNTLEFKDLYLDGTANIDSLVADTADINGGTIDGTTIGGSTPAAGSFTGLTLTGDATFGDNDKAIFGAGSDLQIYHDGSTNQFISGGPNMRFGTTGEAFITLTNNGEVTLYHNNSAKLATTATGIDVTGTVTADGAISSVDSSQDKNNVSLDGPNSVATISYNKATAIGNNDELGKLDFYVRDGSNNQQGRKARIQALARGAYAGDSHPTAIDFFTTASASTSLSRQMRIDANGNLLFNSGFGSIATAYGCRAWVNFDGTGTVAIRASGNVSSINDIGTGDYTIILSSSMPDANYSISGMSALGDNFITQVSSLSAGNFRVKSRRDDGVVEDSSTISAQVFR